MRKKKFLALSISILLMFTSCDKDEKTSEVINLDNFSNIEIEYETATVKREDINQSIKNISLFLFPDNSWDVSFKDDVVIKEVYAEYRKPIEKGELVLELDTAEIDQMIQRTEFDIEIERAAYDEMEKSGASKSELRIKELEIEILKEQLEESKREREKYKIYAPTRCYINKSNVVKGAKIPEGETVVVLSDLSKFEIRTHEPVDMTMFDNVSLGEKVIFNDVDKEIAQGEVSFMTFNQKNLGNVYFKVEEGINFDKSISHGIPLWAMFPEVHVNDVLTVPQGAIKFNQKYYVEVIKDGIRRMRYIKYGVFGLDKDNKKVVQITSGLSEGEEVVVRVKRNSDK